MRSCMWCRMLLEVSERANDIDAAVSRSITDHDDVTSQPTSLANYIATYLPSNLATGYYIDHFWSTQVGRANSSSYPLKVCPALWLIA